ncbi:MAG: TetR/AcrR family transcriptional regulator [Leptospira sp.]|nr:TetR/AcrR family transcriptional regulator [Leptospira sp.]
MANLTINNILRVSIQILEKQGWEGFSMRGLAKKLYVDPMAVYHYYPSKENLIQACIQKVFEGFQWGSGANSGKNLSKPKSLESLGSPKTTNPNLKDRNLILNQVMDLLFSYRDFFFRYPNCCLYLLNHGYTNIPKLQDFNEILVQTISAWEKDFVRSVKIRDILIDYLHGHSMSILKKEGKSKRKRMELEKEWETSIRFLIERLFS